MTATRSVQKPTTDRWVGTEHVVCTAREGIEHCVPGVGYQWGLVFTPTDERATVVGAFLSYVPTHPLLGQQKYLLLRLADGTLALGDMHWDCEHQCHRLVRSGSLPELDLDRMAEMIESKGLLHA